MSGIIDGYCTPGTERETQLRAGDLLEQMDAANIAQAVIAPEDREIAVNNRSGNERMLRMADDSAGRFIPACTVNPWFGDEGCRLLEQVVEAGAKMLVLVPAVQGFMLTDEVTDPLLQAAADLRVPVYVHTGPHSSSAPTQLVVLATQHPRVPFIMGHCGSTDYAHDMAAILKAIPANVWLEVSFVRPWVVPAYAALVDETRLVFGSSAPRNSLAFELRHLDEHWPIAAHPGTYGGNLARLIEEGSA